MDAPNRTAETSKLTPSEAKQVPFSEKLPNIEDTLQMARLANMVYDEKPIASYKEAGKSTDPKDGYKKHLQDEGGKDAEMWYYECDAEGTEAIVTFFKKKNRCTVVFRGTEVGGDTTYEETWKDVRADLTAFGAKVLLAGPDDEKDDRPGQPHVHKGFRSQYYGKVTAFRNDGEVRKELAADGTIEGMVLETALFQKVEKVLKLQELEGKKDTELFVTGHSLGAALSVLCGIRLALKYPERHVQVINFGCPKVVSRAPNLDYNHVGHTIQIDEDAEPRAFKWHAGCSFWTNWNPIVGALQGGVGDHSMSKYVKALNTHANSRSKPAVEKQWVTEYAEE